MTQILLIEKNTALSDILKLNIKKSYQLDVIEKKSCADGISLLEIVPNIDLIIASEDSLRSAELIEFLTREKLTVPLVWIAKSNPSYSNFKLLPVGSEWQMIVTTVGAALKMGAVAPSEDADGFEPIECNLFLNFTSTSYGCDLYLKMKKEGRDHFVKYLHEKDKLNKEDVEKYMKSGVKDFYVLKANYLNLVNFMTNSLILKMESSSLTSEKRIRVTGDGYQLSVERIQSLSIDKHTLDIVDTSIKSMMSSIEDSNALGNFLKALKENPLSYAYMNAYLNSLILYKVIECFDWSTPQLKAKLSYVAYFHNISLKSERLMKIKSMQELEAADLGSDEKHEVLNHALKSSLVVNAIAEIPDGVATIIKEHHGSKNGVGFPESLSTSITPLSMVFIVVEDFVDEFLKISGDPSRSDFEKLFTVLEAKYTKSSYGITLNALKDMVFKRK